MTFIASVKARNGVAIVADSLGTTTMPMITVDSFHKFIQEKDERDIKVEDVFALFERRAHHTNDYEEKLVKFDEHTAVTIAGSAFFGKQRVSDIIESYTRRYKKKQDLSESSLQSKIKDFLEHVKVIIKEVDEMQKIDTDLVFTHFNIKTMETEIVKALVRANKHENKWDINIEISEFPKNLKVCLNGQCGIANNLMYGFVFHAEDLQQKFVENFIKKVDYEISEEQKKLVLDELRKDIFISFPELLDVVKGFKIRELSLQEAVDLAYLLLKAEMDFQKYTQDIPTIGGVIKVATIDANGYNIVCGDKINSPV